MYVGTCQELFHIISRYFHLARVDPTARVDPVARADPVPGFEFDLVSKVRSGYRSVLIVYFKIKS